MKATDRPIELVFTRLKSLVDIQARRYSFFSPESCSEEQSPANLGYWSAQPLPYLGT